MKNPNNKYSIFYILLFFLIINETPLLAQTNFWIQVDPPIGGNVKSFAFSKNNYILTGTKFKGINRSSDRGKSWQPIGLNNISITDIKINSISEIIYAGSENEGLYYSKDYGDSWQLILPELAGYTINCIDFDNYNRILIGTDQGLFACSNDGTNLYKIKSLIGSSSIRSIKMAKSGEILLATSAGIFKSVTADDYTAINNGLSSIDAYSLYVSSSGEILSGTESGLYKFISEYSSWIKLDTNSSFTGVRYIFMTDDKKIYTGTKTSIYFSSDTGKTFQKIFTDSSQVNQIGIDKLSSLFASTEKGFYSYYAGVWTKTGIFQNIFINQIISDKAGNIYTAAADGLYKANSEGKSWECLTSNIDNIPISYAAKDSQGYIFIGTSAGLYKSSNEGQNWYKINAGLLNFNINSLLSTNTVQLCGTRNGLFRSSDNGGSWRQITAIPTTAGVNSLIKSTGGTILAGTSTGIYSSTDNGLSWQPKNSGISISDIYYLEINNTGTIIAGNYSTIYKSTNEGESWIPITINFTNGYIKCAAINSIGEIYLGTNSGAFRSINNGANWLQLNSGLFNIDVRTLRLTEAGYLFAGTNGGGIFKSSLLAPSIPALQYPLNKAKDVAKSLILRWTGSTESLLYRVQVSSSSSFTNILYEDIVSSTSFSLSGLKDYTTYYWRVNSSNGVGESSWSEVWEFTTLMSPPIPPQLLYPANMENYITWSPILRWSAGEKTDSYELQISEMNDFSFLASYFTSIYNTQQIVGELKENTTYYWRVRGYNIGGFGNWSSAWSFRTLSRKPYTPVLISPVNLSTVQVSDSKPELVFNWNKIINAAYYTFNLSTNQNFTSNVIDKTNITDTFYISRSLSPNIYYWRVKATNIYGESSWSPTYGFIMQLSSVENPLQELTYKLNQNYPNPFNPETNITFSVPKTEFVRIKIIDTYGRLVQNLVEDFYRPGEYSIKFSPVNLSSGIYFYQMLTPTFTKTQRMIYMK